MKIVAWLFTSNVGRALLIAVLIVGGASVGKLYYQHASVPEVTRSAQKTEAILEQATKRLEAWRDAQKSPSDAWPTSTPWSPRTLECGRKGKATNKEAQHPTWKILEIDLSQETRYQYRFSTLPEGFELLARTDSDCDGVFHVVRIRGIVGALGLNVDQLRHDHPKE